ncbi:MAG: DUF262 domain-containing protein [Bryobacterales bacterium]|nr:DUF262 domain-containing protein [Bryobacterales bacterium]
MTESKAQIAFQQIGIAGVLRHYRLKVPPNQREFSWTRNEVTTLLQDFSKAISDGDSEYFLGTLVTIPRSPASLEVVDGQQRLATTAILLSAIRDYLAETETLISESINNVFLTDIDRERRERVSKLQLNVDDNEFFRNRIASNIGSQVLPSRSSHKLIDEAFIECSKHVKRVVAEFDRKDHGDVLNKWIGFVEHGAQVILLRVPSDVNAYKMFETLNDRGLKTSQADLIKNYLFGQSDERLNESQQKWARMRGSLESLEENDITVTFLRYALIAIRGYLREKQVYDAVQEKVRRPQSAIEFLEELEMLAASYVTIFNPDHERWNKYPDSTRRAIQTLNLLNIRPLRPLMLAVAQQFDTNPTAEAFRTFISWGVRLMIASSTRSGSVERPLANAAHAVLKGEIRDTVALKAKLSRTIPTDEQFKQGFQHARVSKALLARYYLRSLEMAEKGEATPWFIPNDDKEVINLEHVLPQRPQDNWPMFDDESVKLYAKRIGNLALLLAKSNSGLKSASFADKREVFKKSPYLLTRQISDEPSWTKETIVDRQIRLANLALRAWPL